jgi:plastocyanin
LVVGVAAVAVTAILSLVPGAAPAAGATSSISIVDTGGSCTTTFCYEPTQLTVAPGTTVTWTDHSVASHTVTRCDSSVCTGMGPGTGSDPAFDSGSIAPGGSYSHTFTGVGTYNYYCAIHGFAAMHGTVTVSASPTTTTTTSPPTTTTSAPSVTTTTSPPTAATPSAPPTGSSGSGSSPAGSSLAATGPGPALRWIFVVGVVLVLLGVLSLTYLTPRRVGSRRRAD